MNKKRLGILLLNAVCGISLILVSQAQTPPTKVDATGIVLLKPEGQRQYDPIGSGIYLGRGIVLTNWHIATNAALLILQGIDVKNEDQVLNYQIGGNSDARINSWICSIARSFNLPRPDRLQYRVSPTNTNNCIPYNLTQWQAFRPSQSVPSSSTPALPMRQLLFLSRNLEIAVVKLDRSQIDRLVPSPPCLEIQPIAQGEKLTIQSHAYGRYPAETVTAIVQDNNPILRLDPDPRVSVKNRYAAMSIVATLPSDRGDSVGPGSSGGPVFNKQGKLVGLVWTGQDRPDGIKEAWITPTSVWLPELLKARIPDRDLEEVLNTRCSIGLVR